MVQIYSLFDKLNENVKSQKEKTNNINETYTN